MADDFFGPQEGTPSATAPAPNQVPSGAQDFFGPIPQEATPQTKPAPNYDYWFSGGPVGPATEHILHAFGQDAKTAFGAEPLENKDRPLGLDQATSDYLGKLGVFNDYKNQHYSFWRNFNEAIIRPAAAGADLLLRAGNPLFGGMSTEAAINTGIRGIPALFAGTEAAVAQAGVEVGQPELGRTLAGMVEYAGQRGDYNVMNITARARNLGVVGEGEAGYFGTKEVAPENLAARAEAARQQMEAEKQTAPPSPEGAQPAAAQTAQAAAPTIHDVARQLDPVTFQKYDALATQKDTFRGWINDLSAARRDTPEAQELQGQIDTILGKVSGVEDRLTNAAAQRLETARTALDEYMRTDTPEMAAARQNLLKADYAMRDLAPQVAATYRRAQGLMPEPEGANVTSNASQTSIDVTQAEGVSGGVQAPSGNVPEAPGSPQREGATPVQGVPGGIHEGEAVAPKGPTIANDVAQKLVAAGRPEEEANAAAAIVQAHYEARAARFGGDLGSPEQLYSAEAPEIAGAEKGGRGGAAAGKTVIRNGRATITLFQKADASSFMHETGHQWLEELMRDAKNEAAPPDLTADAKTVRDWLGVKEDEAIPTRAHEKFARGFERYLMEGVAPSNALANVFAKFKAWLTQIYQTVQKLRSPITDDIRDVFDRLITQNPEKTVIAPERTIERDLADIHEADAETTPPEKATEVAENMRGEIDRRARVIAPEVHDELPGKAEIGGIAGENARPPGGGNAPEPAVAEGGGAQESGAVAGGGNETPAEGANVRGGARGAEAEAPTGLNEQFPERESGLIDKAGNIRLDNLNTTEDVNAVIREMADKNSGFIGARRGVVSDEQVSQLAFEMDLKPGDLDIQRLRAEFSPERALATRQLFVQTSNEVQALSVKAANGSEADVLAYAQARSRMGLVQQYLSALTAEWGRTGRAFRAIGGLPQANSVAAMMGDLTATKTLFQLRREAQKVAQLDDPAKAAGFLRDQEKPGLGAMALELFTNSLISGPITHATYSIGNTLLALYKAIPETLAESIVGKAHEIFTGTKEERTFAVEALGQAYGLFRGQRNGWQAAWDSFKAGQTMPVPGEQISGYTLEQVKNGYRLYDEEKGTFLDQGAVFKNISDAVERVGGSQATTPFTRTKAIPDIEIFGGKIPIGSAARFAGERMVAPLHSYFRSIGYSQSIAGQAYHIAAKEDLSGNAFAQRIAELTTEPTKEMMETARLEATEQTLMGRGGALTQGMSKFVNWEARIPGLGPTKPLRFIDPFVHIQSNILEQSILQRGPAGLLTHAFWDDVKGVNGPMARDTAIARVALGTSLSLVAGGLTAEGLINPSGPSDPREASLWQRVNGMPHSVRVGDTSYQLNRLGVLGLQMSIAADLYDVADHASKEDVAHVASLLTHSFVENFMSEGFMKGPSDLIKAVSDSDRYGPQWIRNFASSFVVPYSVGMSQIARQVDPYSRQARTTMDAIKAKIPWESETLFPRRDIWGEPIPNRDWGLVYSEQVSKDPLDKELLDLGVYPATPQRKIRGIELTDQQYDDYSRIAGRLARLQLTNLISMDGWHSIPTEMRVEMVHKIINGTREAARTTVMMQNMGGPDDIVQKAEAAKRALLTGTPAVAP